MVYTMIETTIIPLLDHWELYIYLYNNILYMVCMISMTQ